MKDIPLFTTDYGVASLVLREIPYREEAYITVHSVQNGMLDELIHECASFCTMAGARKVYARGHDDLVKYPLHCVVYEMKGTAWVDPEQLMCLFPVTESTVSQWRMICNERMRDTDCAATQTAQDEKEILSQPGAYFVHQDGSLLGIGWMKDTDILLVCSLKRGMGEKVMHSLMSLAEDAQLSLEVASTNERAIRLYERLGFIKTGEKSRWYRVR